MAYAMEDLPTPAGPVSRQVIPVGVATLCPEEELKPH